jgi:hypothetical protein
VEDSVEEAELQTDTEDARESVEEVEGEREALGEAVRRGEEETLREALEEREVLTVRDARGEAEGERE